MTSLGEPMTLVALALAMILLGAVMYLVTWSRDWLDSTVPDVLIVLGVAAALAGFAWLWVRVVAQRISE